MHTCRCRRERVRPLCVRPSPPAVQPPLTSFGRFLKPLVVPRRPPPSEYSFWLAAKYGCASRHVGMRICAIPEVIRRQHINTSTDWRHTPRHISGLATRPKAFQQINLACVCGLCPHGMSSIGGRPRPPHCLIIRTRRPERWAAEGSSLMLATMPIRRIGPRAPTSTPRPIVGATKTKHHPTLNCESG